MTTQPNQPAGFTVRGLNPAPFQPLYGLDEPSLAKHGARRMIADTSPGFPDRITLQDVPPGTPILLLNYTHQPANTPYRASHAIFVREGAAEAAAFANTVPDAMLARVISLRAFDDHGEMLDAELATGDAIAPAITRLLANPQTAYLHAHYATRGCFAARIDRLWAAAGAG